MITSGSAIHGQVTLNAGPDRSLRIGGRVYDEIDPVESWQLSDAEVGLATLFLHRDYEDYYGRHGAMGYVGFNLNATTTFSVSYADERWSSRPDRDPFSLFRNTSDWRFNPNVDDGLFHIAGAHFGLDTRNDESDPWAGWYLTADVEEGVGVVTSFGPRTNGSTPIAPPSGVNVQLSPRVPSMHGGTTASVRLSSSICGSCSLAGSRAINCPWSNASQSAARGRCPGFDFRNPGAGADVATCSAGPNVPPGSPAQCERIALAQLEFRHDLRVGLADLVRGVPLDGAWIVFADAGRGWLVGYTRWLTDVPRIDTASIDDVSSRRRRGHRARPFGFYIAQPLSPWTGGAAVRGS